MKFSTRLSPVTHSADPFTPLRTGLATLVCAALLAPFANRANADVFFTPDSFGVGNVYTTPQSFGDTFTPTANITVTALGFYDVSGGGLIDSHNVGIFNSAGTLLSDATVPSGTGGTLVDSFRYESISPLSLTAGDTYTLAGLVLTEDDTVGYSTPAGVTIGPGISVSADPAVYVFAGGPTVADPTLTGISATFYIGPNFEYQSSAVGAPDAGSWISILLAGGFLASLRRRIGR